MSKQQAVLKYPVFDYPCSMTLPAKIREAIPGKIDASMLYVTTMDAAPHHTLLNGARVRLQLTAEESGRRNASYPILLDLKASAARMLAQSLLEMADRAEKLVPGPGW